MRNLVVQIVPPGESFAQSNDLCPGGVRAATRLRPSSGETVIHHGVFSLVFVSLRLLACLTRNAALNSF